MPRAFLARNKHGRDNGDENEDEVEQKRKRHTLPTRPYSPEIPWKHKTGSRKGTRYQDRNEMPMYQETAKKDGNDNTVEGQETENETSDEILDSNLSQTKSNLQEKISGNKHSKTRTDIANRARKMKITKGKRLKVSTTESPVEEDVTCNQSKEMLKDNNSEATAGERKDGSSDERLQEDDSESDLNTKVEYYKDVNGKMITKYICTICWKEFTARYTLTRHMPVHTGERKYKCDVCNKMFKQSSVLSRHKATHTTARPFKCDRCSKAFSRISTLNAHKQTHTGEKAYKCEHCGRGFHQKGNLKNHVYTHTGEKPFKCPVCPRCFNQRSNLTYHMSQCHSKRDSVYTCQLCGEGFRNKSSLMGHEAAKHMHPILKPEIQTLIFVPTEPCAKGRAAHMTKKLDDGTKTIDHQEYVNRMKERELRDASKRADENFTMETAPGNQLETAGEILKMLNKNSKSLALRSNEERPSSASPCSNGKGDDDDSKDGTAEQDIPPGPDTARPGRESKEGSSTSTAAGTDVRVFSYKGEKLKVLASVLKPEQYVEQNRIYSKPTNQDAAQPVSQDVGNLPSLQMSAVRPEVGKVSENSKSSKGQTLSAIPMIKPVAFDQTGNAIVQLIASEGDTPTYGRMHALDKSIAGTGSSSGGMAFRIEPLATEELAHIQKLLAASSSASSMATTTVAKATVATTTSVTSAIHSSVSKTVVTSVPSLTAAESAPSTTTISVVTSSVSSVSSGSNLPIVTVTPAITTQPITGAFSKQPLNEPTPQPQHCCNVSTSMRTETNQSSSENVHNTSGSSLSMDNVTGENAASLLSFMASIAAKQQQEKRPSALKEMLGISTTCGVLPETSLCESVGRTTNTTGTVGINMVTGSSAITMTGSSSNTVTGSSANTLTGSSANTITGSSPNSMTGSSSNTMTGSSANTVTGCSVKSDAWVLTSTMSSSASNMGGVTSSNTLRQYFDSIIPVMKEVTSTGKNHEIIDRPQWPGDTTSTMYPQIPNAMFTVKGNANSRPQIATIVTTNAMSKSQIVSSVTAKAMTCSQIGTTVTANAMSRPQIATTATANAMSRPPIATALPKEYEITHHKLKSGGKVERILLKQASIAPGPGIRKMNNIKFLNKGKHGAVTNAMATQIEKYRKIAPKPTSECQTEDSASTNQNQASFAMQSLPGESQLTNTVVSEEVDHSGQSVVRTMSIPVSQSEQSSLLLQTNSGQSLPTGLLINTPNGPTLFPLSPSQILPFVMQNSLHQGISNLGQGESQINMTPQCKEQPLLAGTTVEIVPTLGATSDDDVPSGNANTATPTTPAGQDKIREMCNMADSSSGVPFPGLDVEVSPKHDSSNVNNLLNFLRLLGNDSPSIPPPPGNQPPTQQNIGVPIVSAPLVVGGATVSPPFTVGGAAVSGDSSTSVTGIPASPRTATSQHFSPKKDSLLVHYLTHLPSGRLKGCSSDNQRGDPLLQGVSHMTKSANHYGADEESSESLIPRGLMSDSPDDSSKSEDFQTVIEKMFSILNSQE